MGTYATIRSTGKGERTILFAEIKIHVTLTGLYEKAALP